MTTAQKIKCNLIIHGASVANGAIGGGLAQIPTADSVPMAGVQVTMVVSLGKVFRKKISKNLAEGIVLGFAAAYAGRAISQAAVGWIPGYGNIINLTTAAALTEAMGWFVAHRLAKGYEISDIMNDVNKEKNTQYYNPFEGRSAHNVKDDEEEEYEEYEKVKDTAGDSIIWESDRYAEYNVEEDDNEDNNEEEKETDISAEIEFKPDVSDEELEEDITIE